MLNAPKLSSISLILSELIQPYLLLLVNHLIMENN